MKSKIIYFALVTLLGCNETTVDKLQVKSDASIPTQQIEFSTSDLLNHRVMHEFDSAYLQNTDSLKEYVVRIFQKDLEGMQEKDIESIKFLQNANIENLGEVSIYSIAFSKDLPEVSPTAAYLIFSNENRQAAILFMSKIELIKKKKNDLIYLVGGRYDIRSRGYAIIYEYQNNQEFITLFDSQKCKECEDGVAISNAGLDCISYAPFSLNFKNEDVNKDGLNDLVYKGKVNYYCEGLETNVGRKDRAPRRSEPITIVFKAVNEGDTFIWKLDPSSNRIK